MKSALQNNSQCACNRTARLRRKLPLQPLTNSPSSSHRATVKTKLGTGPRGTRASPSPARIRCVAGSVSRSAWGRGTASTQRRIRDKETSPARGIGPPFRVAQAQRREEKRGGPSLVEPCFDKTVVRKSGQPCQGFIARQETFHLSWGWANVHASVILERICCLSETRVERKREAIQSRWARRLGMQHKFVSGGEECFEMIECESSRWWSLVCRWVEASLVPSVLTILSVCKLAGFRCFRKPETIPYHKGQVASLFDRRYA